jgi:hypothetical protein
MDSSSFLAGGVGSFSGASFSYHSVGSGKIELANQKREPVQNAVVTGGQTARRVTKAAGANASLVPGCWPFFAPAPVTIVDRVGKTTGL